MTLIFSNSTVNLGGMTDTLMWSNKEKSTKMHIQIMANHKFNYDSESIPLA